jgi:hypothetical protein
MRCRSRLTLVLSFAMIVPAPALAEALASSPPVDNGLMRAPASLRYTCQRIEARLVRAHVGWRVACPTRVPDSQVLFVIAYNGGALSSNGFRAGWAIEVGGSGPLAGASGGHWFLVGGEPKRIHDAYLVGQNAIGHPTIDTTSRSAEIAGHRVRIYFVSKSGMSAYSGHVVAEWTQKGEGWQVSIHGWQHEPQARAMARLLIDEIARPTR